ncbi:tetratricopeptide repeat protein [Nocardioides aestuarii]|uniref:Tetratricopeptide repeat protein n=1 Tax=Nocardioides aestuarii TaxID=252231 RepID=A0ABW4TMX7_9ACTN
MPRFIVLVALALALSVSGGIGLATTRDSEPTPQAATSLAPSAPGQDLTGTIEALQDTLRRLPQDHSAWATLALAYVEQGRVTGVPSYYEKATDAARESLRVQPDDNFEGLAASAAIAAARHDFSGALELADQSLAINPLGLSALAIRVDALTELGRYDDQLKALRVADRRQPSTAVAARYSYAYELRGDLPRAASILESAASTAVRADKAYLLTLLADIERRQGRLAQAGRALDIAEEAAPDYLPAVVSRARWQVAQGDLARAVTTWTRVVSAQPLPEYLTELGELYLHLGRPAEAQRQFDVVEATITLLESGGVDTDLEAAVHEADHGDPERARELAASEWGRRHSVHVADAYAWALHRVGRDGRALDLARRATALGTPDARFWIHRGSIEAALGMDRAARVHLRRGLDGDPGLSLWQRDQAQRVLETLGGAR